MMQKIILKNNEKNIIDKTEKTDENGNINIEEIELPKEEQEYKVILKEITPPDGYNVSGDIEFNINVVMKDGKYQLKDEEVFNNNNAEITINNNFINIKVTNEKIEDIKGTFNIKLIKKDAKNEQVLNEDEVLYGANTNVVENTEKTNNDETNEMQNQETPQNAEINAKQQPSEKTSPQDSKEKILSFEEMYKELFGKEPYGGRKQPEPEKKEEEEAGFYALDDNMEDKNVSIFESNADAQKIQYKFIGIAFNTYIILEIDDELYIMDQHAAHERIMYEKVKKNFFNQAGEKASQLLLLPDIINLTHKEMDIAKDNMAMFRQAGFILEEFGENTIKLSGVPDVCVDLDTEELFKETLDEINTVARTAKQEKEEKFLATVACKAAVKAHMKLTKEEVDSLMAKLLELPNPFTCPHGRPTVIKMSKYEIERKFARK